MIKHRLKVASQKLLKNPRNLQQWTLQSKQEIFKQNKFRNCKKRDKKSHHLPKISAKNQSKSQASFDRKNKGTEQNEILDQKKYFYCNKIKDFLPIQKNSKRFTQEQFIQELGKINQQNQRAKQLDEQILKASQLNKSTYHTRSSTLDSQEFKKFNSYQKNQINQRQRQYGYKQSLFELCFYKFQDKQTQVYKIFNIFKLNSSQQCINQNSIVSKLSKMVLNSIQIKRKLKSLQEIQQMAIELIDQTFQRQFIETNQKQQRKMNKDRNNTQTMQVTSQNQIFIFSAKNRLILITFVQQLIQRILNINYKNKYQRKITAQTFLIDFLEHFYLFNYVINCYQFIHQTKLDFTYYSSLFIQNQNLRQQISNGTISLQETTVHIFWETFFNKQSFLLKRILLQSFLNQQEQNIQKIRDIENISLSSLYEEIYPIEKQKQQIQIEIKHHLHFLQFIHQIVSQLSESKNILLDCVFNFIRFTLINLFLHFARQSSKYLQKSIEIQHGRIHKQQFIKERQINLKWQYCRQTGDKALKLSYQKVYNYIKSIKTDGQVYSSSNVPKVKIFLQEKKQLMGLLIALNTKDISNIRKDFPVHIPVQLYNEIKKYHSLFNSAKNYQDCSNQQQIKRIESRTETIYKFIMELAAKQLFSTKIIQKTRKKQLKKYFGENAVINYEKNQYSQNLQKIYKYCSKDRNISQFNKAFDNFQKQWSIVVIQNIKLCSLFMTAPYYSFSTQIQNERIRIGKKNDPKIMRKQPSTLGQIMKTLDLFFICKNERLNTISLQQKQTETVFDIKRRYIKYCQKLVQYFAQTEEQNIIEDLRITDNQILQFIQEQHPHYKQSNTHHLLFSQSVSKKIFKLIKQSLFQNKLVTCSVDLKCLDMWQEVSQVKFSGELPRIQQKSQDQQQGTNIK